MRDRAAIQQAMAKLSSAHRGLVCRAYYAKRTTQEIAAELGVSECAVRSELHEAIWQFRRNLDEALVTV